MRGVPMRRAMIFVTVCLTFGATLIASSAASAAPLFTQCPAVFADTGCQFLITVTASGVTFAEDKTQGPYEGSDDSLIGIQNNSSVPLSSVPLEGPELFGFDGDGMCDPGGAPVPAGCVVLPKNSAGEPTTTTKCEGQDESCGFEPPPGEPVGMTFGPGITLAGFAANGTAVTGYEGPKVWFSGISCENNSGIVNFSPPIEPGQSTFFSLEEPPEGQFKTGNASTLTTTLSATSVVEGTPVTDTATVGGCTGASAGGSVSYAVYHDSACTSLATQAGSAPISNGVGGASTAESLGAGTYYWQATYSGELRNEASKSECGSEVLTVLAKTTTSTAQSGAGVSGPSLTVPLGTSVTDHATISGTLAKTAGGSVTYTLYKDKKCTVPASSASLATVLNGVAGPSAAVKPKVGTYWWLASYSGDAANAPSASACGSEVLVVASQASGLLPSSKICLSRRKFIAHPRAPKGAKLVHVEVLINGTLKSQGKLTARHTTINLIGLPKGTFVVSMVVTTSTGKKYVDIRTFHTCVPKKHKK